MADNYLEKRMDDYARGRMSAPVRRAGARPGWLSVRCPSLTVMVVDADRHGGADVVETFVQAGCKVMFTAADAKAGATLAQKTGGRFYPCGVAGAAADMARRGEAADVTVICGRVPVPGDVGISAKVVALLAGEPAAADFDTAGSILVIAGTYTAQAARVCLMAAHPGASMPRQVIRV